MFYSAQHWWSRKLMWDQKLSLTTFLFPNDGSTTMRVHLRPSNSASIQKSVHRKRYALEIARRIANFQRTNRVKEWALLCKFISYELVLTVHTLACTLPQVALAISSPFPESHGLLSVTLTALLKAQSLNQCAAVKCALILSGRSATKASDIAEAHWAIRCPPVPTSCSPILHLYYSKKCGIWAPKIVSTRLKLDIGEVIFLTQDPQVLYQFKYNHDMFLQHLLIALTFFFWNRRLAKR